ncbi:MAG TPA: outer membrane protein assembly factor BamD [Terriglobales bacterium]|nr:outer membrane protein assembly factor BamD [Terriglobales bacterium]
MVVGKLNISVLMLLLLVTVACSNKKVQNPLADVGSKQPDKVLFDRSMDAMKHNKFDVARLTLQTLINAYPDSEYVARAKLAVGDSWYAEGGTASLAQAEAEYRDFITFFPNMPEAAEAQLKIANIHFSQMEKPDRDFTHAVRAEDEYRQIILQYPDSKLVPVAKEKLREVQEVLAEREFRVGRFYYLRGSWAAAIARLKGVSDRYPLYSGADEALYMLGQSYEGEIEMIRAGKFNETVKGKLIRQFSDDAAQAYDKIITRYPLMERADAAGKRLEALHRPVPKPTPDAIARNKAEEASRRETGMVGRVWGNFSRHPDTSLASRVGDPALVDPKPTSATEIAQEATRALTLAPAQAGGNNNVSIEKIGNGASPAENQAIPHSGDNPGNGEANTSVGGTPDANSGAASGNGAGAAAGSSAPNAAPNAAAPADPNAIPELAPNVPQESTPQETPQLAAPVTNPPQGTAASPAVPNQVNDAAQPQSTGTEGNASAAGNSNQPQDDKNVSSSRKKRKKHKLLVF